LGSNPAGRKDFLAQGTFCPGSTTWDKSPLEPGQMAYSVVVVEFKTSLQFFFQTMNSFQNPFEPTNCLELMQRNEIKYEFILFFYF
jgi:hypothetical protein